MELFKVKVDASFIIGICTVVFGFFLLVITSLFLSDIGFHQRRCDSGAGGRLETSSTSQVLHDNYINACYDIRFAISGGGFTMIAALIQMGSFALIWLEIWTFRLILHFGVVVLLIISCTIAVLSKIHEGNDADKTYFAFIVLDSFFCVGTGIGLIVWKKLQGEGDADAGHILQSPPMLSPPQAPQPQQKLQVIPPSPETQKPV